MMPTDHTSTCAIVRWVKSRENQAWEQTLLEIRGASLPLPPSKHSGGKYQYVPAPWGVSIKANIHENTAVLTWLVSSIPPPSCSSSDITLDRPKSVILTCTTETVISLRRLDQLENSDNLSSMNQNVGRFQIVMNNSIFLGEKMWRNWSTLRWVWRYTCILRYRSAETTCSTPCFKHRNNGGMLTREWTWTIIDLASRSGRNLFIFKTWTILWNSTMI